MAKKKMSETLDFKMHPKLLLDVIKRQAGTLAKAILEGVMNSVDAKATYCDIALDPEVLIIEDDGEGFPDRETIERCFRTFGQPHEESEQKVYANFRMGRGQLFSFGDNSWRSGEFRMDVDLKGTTTDAAFELYEGEDETSGCLIEVHLYEQLKPSQFAEVVRDVKKYVKYIPIDVHLNDELISRHPAEEKWDYESDNCYVRLKKTGSLAVYNLGAFVKEFNTHTFGRGGEVVSKQQLKLNFARNDVMVSECPIWREVRKFVDKQSGKEIAKKTRMTDAERQRIADMIRFGEMSLADASTKRIITDVMGRHWSLNQLGNTCWQIKNWSVAPEGDKRADRIHQCKTAFVIAESTMERFELQDYARFFEDMREWLSSSWPLNALPQWQYQPFQTLAEDIVNLHQVIPDNELRANERVWLRVVKHCAYVILLALECGAGYSRRDRAYKIGLAVADAGWTDGDTYIAISREWLERRTYTSFKDMVELGQLLLHEYCHQEADTDSHLHTPEFFQAYHDCDYSVAQFAEMAIRYVPNALKALERKITKKQLSQQDLLHTLGVAAKSLEETKQKALDLVAKAE